VGRLEKTLAIAGATALVGAALARLGLGWLRCPRIAKAGKQLCGVNPNLLDSLLADTLLIAGTVSLVDFAKEMQGFTGEVADASRFFWRAR